MDVAAVRISRPRPALAAGVLLALAVRLIAGGPHSRAGLATIVGSAMLGFAEEALFRGVMYRLLEHRGAATAILISALAFALGHVPVYGPGAIPIDLAAGLVLGWQRWASGSWLVPGVTHAVAGVLSYL